MEKYTVKIEGMMCGMCEAHIADALRAAFPNAKKVSANRKHNEATFLSEEKIDPAQIEQIIKATGYDYLGTTSEEYKKKGLFG